MSNPRIQEAIGLMTAFAERTGLNAKSPKQRYLWTDAFAVCNFLGLARAAGDERYADLALRLADQVHHTLGRHRGDDARSGWISGLSEHEGEAHPTLGGLRIGKALPERRPDQPFDEWLEWDRDGQYFHYLTQWMHALDQLARATGQPRFNVWARELAETSHHAFIYRPVADGPRRMYWKMSIDLSRPLVLSMGQHDPLDAYITAVQLGATAARLAASGPELREETRQAQEMIVANDLKTADPLGIGGLLNNAYRVTQLRRQGVTVDPHLLENMLAAALTGLSYYADSGELRLPAERRLAFRELGLAIGLHAVRMMHEASNRDVSMSEGARSGLLELMSHASVADRIISFWHASEHRQAATWSEHRDINEVMLATSLAPEGFLVLYPPADIMPSQRPPN